MLTACSHKPIDHQPQSVQASSDGIPQPFVSWWRPLRRANAFAVSVATAPTPSEFQLRKSRSNTPECQPGERVLRCLANAHR